MRGHSTLIVRMAGLALLGAALAACARPTPATTGPATPAGARAFLTTVNDTMRRLGIAQNQSGWVAQTYITDDSEAIDARVTQEVISAVARFAKDSTRFDQVEVPADERRQLNLLKLSLVMAAPSNPVEAEELTRIATRLRGLYGKGTFCPDPLQARGLLEHRRGHESHGGIA